MRAGIGSRVLDVGCGPGTDTIPLARLVGPEGRVAGVDLDPAMTAEADRRAAEAGVNGWVRHELADAMRRLPYADGEFDACRSERLFQHLHDPAAALAEMARVTKSGGWVVVLDTDHASKSFDTPDVDLERRLLRLAAERLYVNGFSGRTLFRLFRQQGLAEIAVEAVAIAFTDLATARRANLFDEMEQLALAEGVVTPEELERWRANLEAADAHGEFFGTGTGTLIAGRVPAG
jgi:ubiquinone/menaquinone biosynthesis C-methylase UbiE